MTPEQILQRQEHRPWPLPRSPWIMRQTWNDLLFAHWSLPAEALRPLVPPELSLDLYDGKAWVAVTPFHMTDVAFRGMPPLPVLSAFTELNVRTYVTYQGKPGVFFFSLDAARAVAVHAARMLVGLPYHTASMHVTCVGNVVRYDSVRQGHPGVAATFRADLVRIRNLEGRAIELLNSLNLLSAARQDVVRALVAYNQAQYRLLVALGRTPYAAGRPAAPCH